MHKLMLSAPINRSYANFSQLRLDQVRICTFLVHLIDSNNYRNSRCFRMLYGFFCLWHYTIICSNYNYNDICNLCTARPHLSKSFMTGRIYKSNIFIVFLNHISTNMLGNSSGFACCHF